ncbi:outer membrane protein [Pseudodesulfovibrio sp. zrk46]|uniref:outer membrane protein n=1 Tax=Pseudodesulfovibrio sp. zrk46 TaxID=2725288 RepID=UPI001449EAF5|nr:outer membrane protein [Pseudodesulfovibrio sp. zrk46]QJB57105.1 porin family protein [Pseudodesulfovibrio sp. zrk46]
MKKISLALAVMVMSLLISGVAFAGDGGFYGAIKAGGSFLDADKTHSTNATTATVTKSKFSTDSAGVIGAAVGYNWMDMDLPIRTEVEYMYHSDFKYKYEDSNSTLTDEINIQTLMLNGYWDFYNSTAFTPYINAGVGFAWVKEDFKTGGTVSLSEPSSKTNTNFAWNVGAGVGWSITESVILDLAYRYDYYGDGQKVTGTSTGKSVTSQVKDLATHNVLLGLRYQF